MPVLLQVLRLRDAPPAPARARRGRPRCSTTPRAGASRSCSSSPARRPTITRACASASASWGFEDFIAYVVWACQRALERGLLPHTNLGVLSRDDLGAPARGHRLAGADARVGQPRPRRPPGLADQAPRAAAGARSAPPASCGSRSRAASSSASASPRTTGWRRSRRSPRCTPSTATCRRSSCRTSSRTAATTARSPPRSPPRRPSASGAPACPTRRTATCPTWATPIGIEDMKRLVAEARRLMPDVGIQVPPNLADWWPELVAAGATDLGGLSANGDHISPEHPFPSPHQVRKRLAPGRRRADRAPVRLRALHRPRVGRAGRARRHQDEVLELHPAPRLGAHRGAARSAPTSWPAGDRPRPRRRAR